MKKYSFRKFLKETYKDLGINIKPTLLQSYVGDIIDKNKENMVINTFRGFGISNIIIFYGLYNLVKKSKSITFLCKSKTSEDIIVGYIKYFCNEDLLNYIQFEQSDYEGIITNDKIILVNIYNKRLISVRNFKIEDNFKEYNFPALDVNGNSVEPDRFPIDYINKKKIQIGQIEFDRQFMLQYK